MPYKAIYYFQTNSQGWSESWYMNATGLQQASDAISSGAMLNARVNLLGLGCNIVACKVVDLAVPGQAIFTALNTAPPPDAPLTTIRDNATNCINVRCLFLGNYRRTMWLHAVPDIWIQYTAANGVPNPNNPVQARVTRFMNAAAAAGVGGRVISTSATVNVPFPIQKVDIDPANQNVRITLAQAVTYTVKQYVRINKVKGDDLRSAPPLNQSINSIQQVTAVNGNTFDVAQLASDFDPIFTYWGGGVVRSRWRVDNAPIATNLFPQLLSGQPIGFARRKVGKIFFQPAGRQRGVRRW